MSDTNIFVHIALMVDYGTTIFFVDAWKIYVSRCLDGTSYRLILIYI